MREKRSRTSIWVFVSVDHIDAFYSSLFIDFTETAIFSGVVELLVNAHLRTSNEGINLNQIFFLVDASFKLFVDTVGSFVDDDNCRDEDDNGGLLFDKSIICSHSVYTLHMNHVTEYASLCCCAIVRRLDFVFSLCVCCIRPIFSVYCNPYAHYISICTRIRLPYICMQKPSAFAPQHHFLCCCFFRYSVWMVLVFFYSYLTVERC